MDEDFVDRTITKSPDIDALAFIGGFVAAEGCFTRGAPTRAFRFTIGVGADDEPLLHWIKGVLGVGWVNRTPAASPISTMRPCSPSRRLYS